jgi:hypothetical protein
MNKTMVPLLAVILAACGGAAATTTNPSPGFTMSVSPEFVQGLIPKATSGVLVTVTDASPTDVPVQITATAPGADVTVQPAEIGQGEVAEVRIVAQSVSEETPIDIEITATRGAVTQTAARTTSVLPWEDDRGEYADTLLQLFVGWLSTNRPDLGITSTTEFSGSFVAPMLLVVSHYMFMSDQWEIGLSWHVMIAPDDWSEIYLRPRDSIAPSAAFRLASQQAALDNGTIDITEVSPPAEVVR